MMSAFSKVDHDVASVERSPALDVKDRSPAVNHGAMLPRKKRFEPPEAHVAPTNHAKKPYWPMLN
jgi:hypothetical protein